jgi:hypothetical protein
VHDQDHVNSSGHLNHPTLLRSVSTSNGRFISSFKNQTRVTARSTRLAGSKLKHNNHNS